MPTIVPLAGAILPPRAVAGTVLPSAVFADMGVHIGTVGTLETKPAGSMKIAVRYASCSSPQIKQKGLQVGAVLSLPFLEFGFWSGFSQAFPFRSCHHPLTQDVISRYRSGRPSACAELASP